MAKPKLLRRLFREGISEGIQTLLGAYWPLVLPVLTALGQYFTAVAWPIFFAGLSVAVGASIWAVVQIRALRQARRIDDKVTVMLVKVLQAPMADKAGSYVFRLAFCIMSIQREFLYFRLNKLTWEIGDKRPKSLVEIDDDIAVLPPGEMYIQSPTLEDVEPGAHSGKFSVSVQYGRSQDQMEYEISLIGTLRILEVVHANHMYSPDFRWNRMKYEVREL